MNDKWESSIDSKIHELCKGSPKKAFLQIPDDMYQILQANAMKAITQAIRKRDTVHDHLDAFERRLDYLERRTR